MKKVLVIKVKNDFQKIVQEFFTKYLSNERGVSKNTIKNYRDTFVNLFEYIKCEKHIQINKIRMEDINNLLIINFLNWLENEKRVSTSTRNNRLAGLKSFFRYTANHYPVYVNQCTLILDIKNKKQTITPMNYLTIEAIKHLLSMFDTKDIKQLRNLCIVLLLYESGSRVSELINIHTSDLKLMPPHTLVLHGKGNKTRIIPIDSTVINYINNYINIYNINNDDYLFQNSRHEQLTREGITYILNKSFEQARLIKPLIYPKKISPHCLRHSKAMHLLENEVNLVYIRDFLGHESVSTTEIYSKANPEMKRKHLEKASQKLIATGDFSYEEKEVLLEWLKHNI